jgi:hypothetical protein
VEDRVAFATILLAGVTGVLAIATTRLCFITAAGMQQQSRDMQRSISVAERALTELERPVAFVEVTESGIGADPTQKFIIGFAGMQFRYEVINYGRTPAILIERFTKWSIEEEARMPNAINPAIQRGERFPIGCVAGPDRPYDETINLFAKLDIQRVLEPEDWENNRVFFIGYVRYSDIFDGIYTSGFCFVFDTYGKRFVRFGNNAYNYIKTEKEPSAKLS